VIAHFSDGTTRDIFGGLNSKSARKIPRSLWPVIARKLDRVNSAHEIKDLASPPVNRLEALKRKWAGFHSIRVKDPYRIVLLKEFLEPSGVIQVALAASLRIPVQRINTLINGKRGMTAETALLLAKKFKTTPQFWMNLQTAWDLYEAARHLKAASA
jgi:antitoxin HigA-1